MTVSRKVNWWITEKLSDLFNSVRKTPVAVVCASLLIVAGLVASASGLHTSSLEILANGVAGFKQKLNISAAAIENENRQEYQRALNNPETFRRAVQSCQGLQQKYYLHGSEILCAQWVIATRVERDTNGDDCP
jgi:hypothetical protein